MSRPTVDPSPHRSTTTRTGLRPIPSARARPVACPANKRTGASALVAIAVLTGPQALARQSEARPTTIRPGAGHRVDAAPDAALSGHGRVRRSRPRSSVLPSTRVTEHAACVAGGRSLPAAPIKRSDAVPSTARSRAAQPQRRRVVLGTSERDGNRILRRRKAAARSRRSTRTATSHGARLEHRGRPPRLGRRPRGAAGARRG